MIRGAVSAPAGRSHDPTAGAFRGAEARLAKGLITLWARTFSYALRVPGSHPDGLAYDDLLAILKAQGRDFAAPSAQLRDHVRYVLERRAAELPRAPARGQLVAWTRDAVVEWVVLRLEMGRRDVPIKPNAPAYRRWKAAHGPYQRPGMRTGALRDALRDAAEVTVREGPDA